VVLFQKHSYFNVIKNKKCMFVRENRQKEMTTTGKGNAATADCMKQDNLT